MLTNLFEFFIYLNIILSISILIFVIISKGREPKEFPDNFSKKYYKGKVYGNCGIVSCCCLRGEPLSYFQIFFKFLVKGIPILFPKRGMMVNIYDSL